jgi:hypothetical protein
MVRKSDICIDSMILDTIAPPDTVGFWYRAARPT